MIISMPSVTSNCRIPLLRAHASPSCTSPLPSSFHPPLPTHCTALKDFSRTQRALPRLSSSSQQAQPSTVQAPSPPPTSSAYRKKSRSKEDLNDPAQIGATGTSNFKVLDYGHDVSLAAYMMLPVEQYFVLDPKQIRWIEGNRFQLTVPRIELLGIWLEPEVEISVSTSADQLVLMAENCRIRGSDLIENMRLDQRFCLRFVTEITWKTDPFDGASSASSDGSDLDDSPRAPVGQGQILGNARLDVWSEVIPPFNLMPREVLQGSCNLVMSGLVGSLLPLFLQRLGTDYARWATDTRYRLDRAARTKPLS